MSYLRSVYHQNRSVGCRCDAPSPYRARTRRSSCLSSRAAALAHLDIDKRGFAWVPEDDFVNHFAADVDPVKARVMYAVQHALAASTL